MKKSEYDTLINEGYICRIAFNGEKHPNIAPFLYVFDGRFMYFLSTKYGRKVQHFKQNPFVTVEVEKYSSDLSHFAFVAIPGRLLEVQELEIKKAIRKMFVQLIRTKDLSFNVLSALGYSPDEPLEVLIAEDRNSVWKLVGVDINEILVLSNPELTVKNK
ncbi:MAG: pyridoxamine 5'-phosphate oxidase family protein [Methanotrichaceae archaeon]|nr:pyridoxamine 5'-phosphate oxidase family protein [Methanotrichaceae archaeon]